MQKRTFAELGLSPEIQKAVARLGYEEASPIQSEAIPPMLEGKDVVGQSQTGSGKTAAYAIPAIERVDPALHVPQVLIMCPTRELAVQVAEEVAKLAYFKKGVRELPIYGGQSYERQFRGLQAGAQIIIGTPGRIMDHLDRKTLKLDAIRTVILDEADRMLDMGFREDIEKILGQAAPDRQTVFFSATLPPAIQGMIRRFAREPHHIRIESQTMEAPNIEQMYYEVGHGSKLEVLCRLIDLHDFKIGIIFCGTKMGVDQLAEHLQARGYAVDKLHGDIAQQARERVMRRFRERKIEFLIATDVAARGIDVDDVEVVFNYDLPHDPEDYVHRIGRTGRAGRSGRAVSFIAGREIYKLQQILRFTKGRIRRETIPSLDTLEEKRTTSLLEGVRTTLESGEFRKFDSAVDNLVEAGHAPTDIVSALLHLLAGEGGRTGERIPEDNPKPPREAYPSYAGGRGNTRATRGETRDKPNTDEGPLRPARAPAGERPARASAEERPARPSAEERPSRPPAGAREERPARTEERAPQRPREDRPARPATEDAPVSHEQGMTRLALNVGREHGIEPGDVVGVIAGVSRLPREIIGAIRLQPQETWVDVATEHVETVIGKLNGIKFKGHRLAASLAVESAARKKKAVRKE